jgi:hypothetical protein
VVCGQLEASGACLVHVVVLIVAQTTGENHFRERLFGCIAMASAKTYKVSYDNAASAATIAFEKPEGTTFAIWTTSPTKPQAYTATIGEFGSVTCKDLLGKNVPCGYANRKLSVTLSTSVGPVIATARH